MARAFVLRVAFATAVFHAMIALFTIGASDYSNPRIMVHTALWPIKILIWVVLHLIVFFIPSQFFLVTSADASLFPARPMSWFARIAGADSCALCRDLGGWRSCAASSSSSCRR
jgi:hypothetical protein